ncbi:efflux RND transporter periplasmic adaptor subunit, partial [Pseudomonas sp. MWU12-2534b]
ASQTQPTAARWHNLLASHSVAPQDADEKSANTAAAKVTAEGAAAEYARLSELEDDKNMRAPFAGTLTARHTDIGNLIKADNDSDPELFDLPDTHKLRLYVPIPQNYPSVIRPGLVAQLSEPEHPGQHFNAQLLGYSTAIDPRSGPLLAQFVAANPDG